MYIKTKNIKFASKIGSWQYIFCQIGKKLANFILNLPTFLYKNIIFCILNFCQLLPNWQKIYWHILYPSPN